MDVFEVDLLIHQHATLVWKEESSTVVHGLQTDRAEEKTPTDTECKIGVTYT
jgi:hypothetical protein